MPMEDDFAARAEAAPPAAGAAAESGSAKRRSARDAEESRLGTGHGRRLDSGAVYTQFVRASEIARRDRPRLLRLAQEPPRPRHHPAARDRFADRRPEPFPSVFAPDP